MTTRLILDKAGRVVIPKRLREELHLAPGDALQLDTVGEQIMLRPVRPEVPIRKEDGVWVFRSGQKADISIRKLIEEGRDQRHRRTRHDGRCQVGSRRHLHMGRG